MLRAAVIAVLVALAGCASDTAVAPEPPEDNRPAACKVTPHYVDNSTKGTEFNFGGPQLRWHEFPVRVAFDSTTVSLVDDHTAWEAGILQGVHAWDVASGGAIGTISFVADLATADIVVRLISFDDDDCLWLNCLGVVSYEADGRYLQHAYIFLFPEAVTWTRDKVAQITAHEMGHALGMMFHSTDAADLMYYQALPRPVAERYPWITPSDLNTMTILYCTG